jgi:hypothetical protein
MTTDIPPTIFDSDGALVEISPSTLSTLPPEMRERYLAVQRAYALNAKADHDLADKISQRGGGEAAVKNTSNYIKANFRPLTHFDLLRSMGANK